MTTIASGMLAVLMTELAGATAIAARADPGAARARWPGRVRSLHAKWARAPQASAPLGD